MLQVCFNVVPRSNMDNVIIYVVSFSGLLLVGVDSELLELSKNRHNVRYPYCMLKLSNKSEPCVMDNNQPHGEKEQDSDHVMIP